MKRLGEPDEQSVSHIVTISQVLENPGLGCLFSIVLVFFCLKSYTLQLVLYLINSSKVNSEDVSLSMNHASCNNHSHRIRSLLLLGKQSPTNSDVRCLVQSLCQA